MAKKADAIEVREASLFEVSNDLRQIFAEIEDLGGELTDDIVERLKISQDMLAVKTEKYIHAIKAMDTFVASCKKEKERINTIQKRNENNIDRLKRTLIEAILEFGDETKTGTKFINAGLNKASCRKSRAVVIDSEFTSFVVRKSVEYMKNLYETEKIIFYRNPESNIVGLIDYVNNSIKESFPETDYYVDEDILSSIMVKGEFSGSIMDLIYSKPVNAVVITGIAEVKDNTSITSTKKMIEEGKPVNYAYQSNDYNLTIS